MASPNWHIFDGLTGYEAAQQIMREHQQQLIASEGGTEQIMLLSHPPLYTAGTSARPEDLLARQKAELSEIEIFENTGRGGQWTYHGPGQRIVWPVLDLNRRTPISGFMCIIWKAGLWIRWPALALTQNGVKLCPEYGSGGMISDSQTS